MVYLNTTLHKVILRNSREDTTLLQLVNHPMELPRRLNRRMALLWDKDNMVHHPLNNIRRPKVTLRSNNKGPIIQLLPFNRHMVPRVLLRPHRHTVLLHLLRLMVLRQGSMVRHLHSNMARQHRQPWATVPRKPYNGTRTTMRRPCIGP